MVDLIPEDYRRNQRVQRTLRRFGWASLGIAAALGAASTGLAHAVKAERTALARYKQLQAQSTAQQARLKEVTARSDEAQRQLQALHALRRGAEIARLVDAVDGALNTDVWFRELVFSRGGEAAGEKRAAGDARPPAAAGKDRPAAGKPGADQWQARERAEIRGLALNHAVLAAFIRELGARPEVRQVKLIGTSARSYPNVQVVDFHLAVLPGVAGDAP